jgi:hypothetical protein
MARTEIDVAAFLLKLSKFLLGVNVLLSSWKWEIEGNGPHLKLPSAELCRSAWSARAAKAQCEFGHGGPHLLTMRDLIGTGGEKLWLSWIAGALMMFLASA